MGKRKGGRKGVAIVPTHSLSAVAENRDEHSLSGVIGGSGTILPPYGISSLALQSYAYPLTVLEAAGVSAVRRCVSLIANAIAGREWQEWQGSTKLPPSRIVRRPASLMSRREWTWRVIASMALEDISYLYMVGGVDDEGVPGSLLPLPREAINPAGLVDPFGVFPPTQYTISGVPGVVSGEAVIPVRSAFWPGVPSHLVGILRMARQSLMEAWSAGNYASRYWQHGGSPVTVITTEQELNDPQTEGLASRWRERRLLGPDYPAVFGKGAHAEPYGADIAAASAVEARREQAIDIARLFGVPVTYLGITLSGTSLEYSNLGDQVLSLERFTLGAFVDPIQDTISDLLPGDPEEADSRHMVIDMTPITRGSQEARYRAWQIACGKPWMDPEEVRAAEGLAPGAPVAPPPPMLPAQTEESEGVPVNAE